MTTYAKSQRIIGSILLAGLGLFGPISSASAHTDLVSTSPAADSDVNASQATISLTFAEPTLVDGAAIIVKNSNGDILDSPAPTLDGSTLSIPWPMDLTPGQVTIEWRATGDDGHVLSGDFGFNYTAAAEGGMAPSPAASAEPIMTALATPEAIAMPLAIDDAPADASNNNLVIRIAIVSLVGLVAAGLFLRRSK
ncbi:MAG: copper resistance protein CopC [Actinobacteria bacterium]|nr:copper resistance protein CopC [Actinomycetota bacterium]NBO35102.1 copper resistance protein CopC [Actinomycetota bacterium]